jgi:hypothetical protein
MRTEVLNKTATSIAIKKVLAHPLGVGNALFRTGISVDTFVDTVPFGMYRTELLKSIGGYNVKLIRNHDIELSKRLLSKGSKILLTPEASCTYYARENWPNLAINNFDNGKWNLLTVAITRDFDSLSLRHFIPFTFVLAVLIPLILTFWFWEFSLVSLVVLLLHFGALTAASLRMNKEDTTLAHLITTFLVLHWSYGLGSIMGAWVSIPKLLKRNNG